MINRDDIRRAVEESIAGSDIFIVDVTVSGDNRIVVEIDSPEGLDIDTCARITRDIEQKFDREQEDYELEVGSAGLTSPFKVKQQYDKNLGNEVEVLTRDGRKLHGTLSDVTDDGFTISTAVKEKVPGKKRPEIVEHPETFTYDAVKSVKYLIQFK